MTNTLYSKSGFGDCNGLNKGSVPRSSIYKDLVFQGVDLGGGALGLGSFHKRRYSISSRSPIYTASGINMELEDS